MTHGTRPARGPVPFLFMRHTSRRTIARLPEDGAPLCCHLTRLKRLPLGGRIRAARSGILPGWLSRQFNPWNAAIVARRGHGSRLGIKTRLAIRECSEGHLLHRCSNDPGCDCSSLMFQPHPLGMNGPPNCASPICSPRRGRKLTRRKGAPANVHFPAARSMFTRFPARRELSHSGERAIRSRSPERHSARRGRSPANATANST